MRQSPKSPAATWHRIQVLFRELREAGLIATGGRGTGGKEMSATDAACLLLAAACGGPLNRAADEVANFWYRNRSADEIWTASDGELRASGFRQEMIDRITEADSFGEAVDEIIRCLADKRAFKRTSTGAAPFMKIEIVTPAEACRIVLGFDTTEVLGIDYGAPVHHTALNGYIERHQYGRS